MSARVDQLADQIEGQKIRPAEPELIQRTLGARPGSLGAVGRRDLYVVADEAPTEAQAAFLAMLRQSRVKLGLVLETIAEKEGLTVTQDDFNSEIVRLASELKMPAADLVKIGSSLAPLVLMQSADIDEMERDLSAMSGFCRETGHSPREICIVSY